MKIVYEFLDTEFVTVDVEVSNEVENYIIKSDRYIHANDVKQHSHCYSLDQGMDMGIPYYSESNAIEEMFSEPSKKELLWEAVEKLKPKQKALIKAIYYEGVSVKDYAEIQGVVPSAISNQLRRAKKNIKKFLKKP
ncbi:MAG: sigma-70 family RNA polymerase sigma factor [Clostridia bacterium]|nr:sigma-70 family RNA polymerase sigma factor [Clostridia bacterium]